MFNISQTDFQQNKDWNIGWVCIRRWPNPSPRPISNKTRIETRVGVFKIAAAVNSQTDFQQNKDWNKNWAVASPFDSSSQTDFQQNKDWNFV